MERFKIQISSTAEKQLKKLPKEAQNRISQSILNLALNPYPHGCKKLTGEDDVWRIRIGDYRVLYSIEKTTITIVVLKIGHRKQIYR